MASCVFDDVPEWEFIAAKITDAETITRRGSIQNIRFWVIHFTTGEKMEIQEDALFVQRRFRQEYYKKFYRMPEKMSARDYEKLLNHIGSFKRESWGLIG